MDNPSPLIQEDTPLLRKAVNANPNSIQPPSEQTTSETPSTGPTTTTTLSTTTTTATTTATTKIPQTTTTTTTTTVKPSRGRPAPQTTTTTIPTTTTTIPTTTTTSSPRPIAFSARQRSFSTRGNFSTVPSVTIDVDNDADFEHRLFISNYVVDLTLNIWVYVMFFFIICCILSFIFIRRSFQKKLNEQMEEIRKNFEQGRVQYFEDNNGPHAYHPKSLSPPLTDQEVYYPLGEVLRDDRPYRSVF